MENGLPALWGETVVSKQEPSRWHMKVTETLLRLSFASLVTDDDGWSRSTDLIWL